MLSRRIIPCFDVDHERVVKGVSFVALRDAGDPVELARLYLTWPSPALFAPGDAELDLVADILANGRSSRLYRRLIHDRRVASELAAHQTSRELGGLFQIVASAAPGHTLADIAEAFDDEVRRFADEGPTDAEVNRGRARAEAATACPTPARFSSSAAGGSSSSATPTASGRAAASTVGRWRRR